MMRKSVYRLHRIFSIAAMVPLLMWTTSAILHQANKYIRPQVNTPVPANYTDPVKKALAISGSIFVNGGVKEINEVTRFNDEYPASQKILPVMQVKFLDDLNTVAFIDPVSGNVIRTANDNSRLIHKWFGYLHAYKFIPDNLVRTIVVIILSLITLMAAISGFYVHFILRMRNPNSNKAKWMILHRFAGLFTGLFLVTFSLSGFLHAFAELYPAIEGFEKKIFSYVHMLKFLPSSMEPVRFWALTLLATVLVLMLVTGIILATYFLRKNTKKHFVRFRLGRLIDYGRLSG